MMHNILYTLVTCVCAYHVKYYLHHNFVHGLAWCCSDFLCEDGNIRLADGESQSKGRLEVCRDGQWWAVLSKGLLETQGDQLCDQLGFSAEGKDAAVCNK